MIINGYKDWNNICIYKDVGVYKLLYKHSLCVLLQDDQSTPWSSVNAKQRMGNHTNPLKTEQHLVSEKTLRKHSKKAMTQANNLGTISQNHTKM